MKRHYDFSKAEKGKFYRPIEELEIPVYLEKKVKAFFMDVAERKKVSINKIINMILTNEMKIHKTFGNLKK
jgi:hypothetical protein